jgi:hypothetical protein
MRSQVVILFRSVSVFLSEGFASDGSRIFSSAFYFDAVLY